MTGAALRRGTRLGAERVSFTFDGKRYEAQSGDSVASALLANGIRMMGRSVKYHRPRGVLTAGPEEPNALFSVGHPPFVIPNVAAPQLAVSEGLVLRSQNRWPSLNLDLAAMLNHGGGLLGAGFYYKTFMWPSWRTYEGLIRRLAGLGEAPRGCNLPRVTMEHLSCDVLVGGAGPAGLAAALAAARAGARVIVCEREPLYGGELEFEEASVDGKRAAEWVSDTLAELGERRVRLLNETAVIGGTGGIMIAHREPGGLPGLNTLYRIRSAAFVAAMGSVERPIAFVDNDLPGVMLLGSAERYLARYGVRVGSELVLFANHDRVYAAATRFLAAGMRLRAIVDTRSQSEFDASPGESAKVRAELGRSGVECLLGHAVISARGGRAGIRAVWVVPLANPEATRRVSCDALLMSGGWTPSVHAGLQEGGKARFSGDLGAFVATQSGCLQNAGAANGALTLGDALADGRQAGRTAARLAGGHIGANIGTNIGGNIGGNIGANIGGNIAGTLEAGDTYLAPGDPAPRLVPFWRSPAPRNAEKRQFVDYQNDVTVADLRQAFEEGFLDIEHVKRYTTLSVGTDQGRIGGVLGAAIIAEIRGKTLSEVGMSRLRPPFHPVTLQSLAGHRVGTALRVTRRTPLHAVHEAQGAALESMGLWMRPRYYAANGGDAFTAGIVEARRVREVGGISDASTLGKIKICGPEAAEFLDRMYLTKASTIKVGRAKYMVNLREDGMVLDDGVVLRLAEDRFLATTGSGHGEQMLSHFEHYRDTEWAGRRVTVTDVTEAWAVIVVAGPRSRDTLHRVLGTEWQEAVRQIRHMDFAAGVWRERELRLLRASFSGELAFELHCRPDIAQQLWEALRESGLAPYGLEALDILRVEKGYLVSSELNGQTTPFDLGMSELVKRGNPCIGSELLDRVAFHDPSRPHLVGIRAADGRAKFLAGAQLTAVDEPYRARGFVTSSVYSPALGEWIGLGLLARSLAGSGTLICARDPLREGDTRVRITPTVHFDPAGERLRV